MEMENSRYKPKTDGEKEFPGKKWDMLGEWLKMTKPDATIYELIDKKLDKVEGRIVRRLDRIDDRLDA